MNIDLDKLRAITVVSAVLIFIAIICPGVLLIFCYDKELFRQIDILKLILLGGSITIPIWLINSVLWALNMEPDKNSHQAEDNFKLIGMLGGIFTIPILYLPIVINFFIKISFKVVVVIIILLQLVLLFILLNEYYKSKRKKINNQ